MGIANVEVCRGLRNCFSSSQAGRRPVNHTTGATCQAPPEALLQRGRLLKRGGRTHDCPCAVPVEGALEHNPPRHTTHDTERGHRNLCPGPPGRSGKALRLRRAKKSGFPPEAGGPWPRWSMANNLELRATQATTKHQEQVRMKYEI